MKKAIFLKVIILLAALFFAAVAIVTIGIRYGKSNRDLLTMRSGLIKMRKGFNEFFTGFSKYVGKGLVIQDKQFEKIGKKELKRRERERLIAEREQARAIAVEPLVEDVEAALEATVDDEVLVEEPEGGNNEEVL